MKKLILMVILTASCAAQGIGGKAGIGGNAGMGGGFVASVAIAFDNSLTTSQTSGTTNLTYAFNADPGGTGTNKMLFVGVTAALVTPTVTYNGTSMTLLASVVYNFGVQEGYLYGLVAPASGSNNVSITVGTATAIVSTAVSYTGVKQIITPDASTTSSGSGATSGATLTLTTVADNCWTIMYVRGAGGSVIAAGSGTTLRNSGTTTNNFLDSNGPITPPGSTSLIFTLGSNQAYAAMMVSYTHA